MWYEKIFGLFTMVFGASLDEKSRNGDGQERIIEKKISFSEQN